MSAVAAFYAAARLAVRICSRCSLAPPPLMCVCAIASRSLSHTHNTHYYYHRLKMKKCVKEQKALETALPISS